MNAKDKCNWTRKIREQLAEKYNIPGFKFKECDFEGECQGYCPKCDAETEELYLLIHEKEMKKYNILQVPGGNDWEGDLQPRELILGRLESYESQNNKTIEEDTTRNPRGVKKKKGRKKNGS